MHDAKLAESPRAGDGRFASPLRRVPRFASSCGRAASSPRSRSSSAAGKGTPRRARRTASPRRTWPARPGSRTPTPRRRARAVLQPLAASAAPASSGARDAEAPLSGAPVGHLQGPQRLTHLFEALAKLDDGHAHDDVRILQYGDSHTASDLGRRRLPPRAAGALRRRGARLRLGGQALEELRAGRRARRDDEGVRAVQGHVQEGPDLRGARRRLRPARRGHRVVEGRRARVDRHRRPLVAHRARLRAGPARRQLRRLHRRRARRARGDARQHGGLGVLRVRRRRRPAPGRGAHGGRRRGARLRDDARPARGRRRGGRARHQRRANLHAAALERGALRRAAAPRVARPRRRWPTARTRRWSPASPTPSTSARLVDFLGRVARAAPDVVVPAARPARPRPPHEGPERLAHVPPRLRDHRPRSARSPRPRAAASTTSWRRWAARAASRPGPRSPSPAPRATACTSRGAATRRSATSLRDETCCTPTTSGAPRRGLPPTARRAPGDVATR